MFFEDCLDFVVIQEGAFCGVFVEGGVVFVKVFFEEVAAAGVV